MTLSGFVWLYLQVILFATVLIPLLVDDPLWAQNTLHVILTMRLVLIPLLVDDPLWGPKKVMIPKEMRGLNPSFSG